MSPLSFLIVGAMTLSEGEGMNSRRSLSLPPECPKGRSFGGRGDDIG